MSTAEAIRSLRLPTRLSAWRLETAAKRSADSEGATAAAGLLLGSRLLVWGAVLGAVGLFGSGEAIREALDPESRSVPFHNAVANLLFAPSARYDAIWYLHIAQSGYWSRSSSAFFPLLPMLLHVGGAIFGSTLVFGTLLSLAAMALGGYLLYLLARLDLSPVAARMTVVLLAVFPTSLFFSAIYSESLFLALSVGCLYAARTERWALAGLLGALAGATRMTGVLLILPLAILFLYGPRALPRPAAGAAARWRPRYAPSRSLLWIALVPSGAFAYFAYLGIKHGAPFAPLQVEAAWGRYFAGPFGGVVHAVLALPGALRHVLTGTEHAYAPGTPLGWEDSQLIDFGFLAFAVAGLWFCCKRLPVAYLAYAVALVAQALSYPTHVEPMESFSRYLLVIFPVFMGWGAALAEARPALRRATVTTLVLGLVGYCGMWAIWAWVA